MLLDWVSFLAYPNLFGIKGFVVVFSSTIYYMVWNFNANLLLQEKDKNQLIFVLKIPWNIKYIF
jgi:hypothetical protein